jgi:hypothetical protein
MNHIQVNGTDFHNFPGNEDVKKSLFWMGENYLSYLLKGFTGQFKTQDPGTEIVAVKCEEEPEFSYVASNKDGKIHGVTVKFKLQFLLLTGNKQHWRLHGAATYSAKGLHTEAPQIDLDFDLERSEQV